MEALTTMVNGLVLQKAMTLQESLIPFGIEHDLYICLAAVIFNKVPRDVTQEERLEAKKALYIYSYSN